MTCLYINTTPTDILAFRVRTSNTSDSCDIIGGDTCREQLFMDNIMWQSNDYPCELVLVSDDDAFSCNCLFNETQVYEMCCQLNELLDCFLPCT